MYLFCISTFDIPCSAFFILFGFLGHLYIIGDNRVMDPFHPYLTLLVHKLYSQKAKDFVSENSEIIDAVRRIYKATEGKGIFVLDRGGDRLFGA